MACLSRGAARRPVSSGMRLGSGNIGINVGVAAPMAYFPFSGWKDSFFGDLHAQGRDAIDFYTEKKIVVERWPANWSRKIHLPYDRISPYDQMAAAAGRSQTGEGYACQSIVSSSPILVFSSLGLVRPTAQQGASDDVPTFNKDVAPILYRHCTQCHRPGETAPMSLLTYEAARPGRDRFVTRFQKESCRPGMRMHLPARSRTNGG